MFSEELRRVRQLEVFLLSGQILLQFHDYASHAPPAVASGYQPHALLERAGRFEGDPAQHRAAIGVPEAIAQ